MDSKVKKFKPVEAKPDFVKKEKKLLDWWYGQGVVDRYLKKNEKAEKKFFFLDGPITANNPMGVHHAWGRTLKDLYQRYHCMRGKRQRFQNGFDCQGLWVEVEVEKELGFKNKKDIEGFGIAKFVEKCKKRVEKYAKVQTEQSKRLGYFMDWDNSYYTMSDENNYMIWHVLKLCWEKGWLYKGLDVVPWCVRCGTAMSQHEILTEEYKELTHKAVFFKYPLVDTGKIGGVGGKTYLLVWTTTPWTIPGNVVVAVNPKLTYMLLEDCDSKEEYVVLGEQVCPDYSIEDMLVRAGIGNYEIKKKFLGKDLVGLTYSGPFDDLPVVEKAREEKSETFHKVIGSKDLVTGEEGTALVHMSTGTGREDFKLGKEKNLPFFTVVDGEGKYLSDFGDLTGKNATVNPDLILDILKRKGFLQAVENYKHRYPTCWRCKSELIFRAVDEWYIAMDRVDPGDNKKRTLRSQMIDVAKTICWIPSFGLDRELDWLSNMDDWLISKKRYWGLALPIWVCACGNFEVIGSREELKKKAVSGWEEFEGKTPHRPWVDKLEIKCPKCGGKAKRIADVGTPWLDAGIVSFSTLIDPKDGRVSYLTDKNYWKEWFPADFITECFPGQFKNWFYSLIAMSTILERVRPYKTLLGHATVRDEAGEEMHKSKGNAIWFDQAAEKMGVDVMRWMYSLQNPVHNLNFGYNRADETRRRFHLVLWNVYRFFVSYALFDKWKEEDGLGKSSNVLDRWILSRLAGVGKKVTSYLDKYSHNRGAEEIEKFINDLSVWYLRRSRERAGPLADDAEDKKKFYQTLYFILVNLAKILAPFVPFLAEDIFKNLTNKESVHLADWPEISAELRDKKLEEVMVLIRLVCEKGHSERKDLAIRVRQPLALIKVEFEELRELVGEMKDEEKKQFLDLIKQELNVKKVEIEKGKELKVILDTKLTDELKQEAEAREIIRKIQNLRKREGVEMEQMVLVYLPSWPAIWEDYIKKKTLAKELKKGELAIKS